MTKTVYVFDTCSIANAKLILEMILLSLNIVLLNIMSIKQTLCTQSTRNNVPIIGEMANKSSDFM